jgi:dihydrofolate synthase / folylpolyglutamate synthase
MRLLSAALGFPQNRFATIHVVGTNGKSSVATMSASLLEAHGVRAGAYLSPHIDGWLERIRIGETRLDAEAFGDAVGRAAEAAGVVEERLAPGEKITQFELATAAGFCALAAAGVQVGVIEAGLGGRLDATNVITSRVTVLTSIGLEHTEWLGQSEAEIAAEKLAVLRDHSLLVCGPLSPQGRAVAERAANAHRAELVHVDVGEDAPGVGYQRLNAAIAGAAARPFVERLDPDAVRRVAERTLSGRLELVAGDPPTLFDAAHNPAAATALVSSLPELVGERPVVACLAVLADKDAAGIVAALAPACRHVVCTELPEAALSGTGRPGARALPVAELAEICTDAGVSTQVCPDPGAALAEARRRAAEISGVAVVTGSHYLLRCLWTERRAPSSWR